MATTDDLEYVLGSDSASADRLRAVIDAAWDDIQDD